MADVLCFQQEYDFYYKSPDCTQSSIPSYYMSAVYPTSTGYPGVYCDFGLYPYPVAYRRAYDDGGYCAYDRKYSTEAAAAATQRLRSYYGSGATARSAFELSPSSPSPEVAARVPPSSSCRLAKSSESAAEKMAYENQRRVETSIPEVVATAVAARSCAYAAGYAENGSSLCRSSSLAQRQQNAQRSPPATAAARTSSSSCVEAGPHGPAATSSPVNLASGGGGGDRTGRWTERRTVIMGDRETGSGDGQPHHHHNNHHHHQSVIRRTRHEAYDPSPIVSDPSQQRLTTVGLYDSAGRETAVDEVRRQTTAAAAAVATNSTIHDAAKTYDDYHRQLKAAAAAASQPTPGGIYPSVYYASQLGHGSSPTNDVDEAEEDFSAAAARQLLPGAAAGARTYFRVGCAATGQQQQHGRLQHHAAAAGSHVTGYTSVIVDTQQLHANGYVH